MWESLVHGPLISMCYFACHEIKICISFLYVNTWHWRFVRVFFKCFACFLTLKVTSFLVPLGSVSSVPLPTSSWARGSVINADGGESALLSLLLQVFSLWWLHFAYTLTNGRTLIGKLALIILNSVIIIISTNLFFKDATWFIMLLFHFEFLMFYS